MSQNIAGALWGHMAIPRIGQEVIVSNFDGDPDQPVITGRVYTGLQRPPYELPRHKTRMTIKSQSHNDLVACNDAVSCHLKLKACAKEKPLAPCGGGAFL